jgi:hypothetical protein
LIAGLSVVSSHILKQLLNLSQHHLLSSSINHPRGIKPGMDVLLRSALSEFLPNLVLSQTTVITPTQHLVCIIVLIPAPILKLLDVAPVLVVQSHLMVTRRHHCFIKGLSILVVGMFTEHGLSQIGLIHSIISELPNT